MKITHLTQSVSTAGGGISEAVRSLSMAQVQGGDTARVLSVQDGGEAIGPWPEGSPEFLAATHLPGMIALPDLTQRLDTIVPDVLHTQGLWTYLSIGVPRWAKRNNRPYIVSPHGMLDKWALNHSRWKKRVAAALYEKRHLYGASCLHALCASEADSIRAFGINNPIAVIPNGIEIPDRKTAEHRQQASDVHKKIMLFLGRIHPKKGLENALRAWAEIRHSPSSIHHQNNWQFVIAGWDQGGHESMLKQLCGELGLKYADVAAAEFVGKEDSSVKASAAQVVFTGPLFGELKDKLLRQSHAFILPSFSEGLPMSILEAWAYELPVVMTEHCNLPEGFDAQAAARIGTDVESISRGMQHVLDASQDELFEMAARGLALVQEKFTWPKIAKQMSQLYDWVIGGSSDTDRPDFVQ